MASLELERVPTGLFFPRQSPRIVTICSQQSFGVLTQDTRYPRDVRDQVRDQVREQVHLLYDVLSDKELEHMKTIELPHFEYQGKKLIKRLGEPTGNGKMVALVSDLST